MVRIKSLSQTGSLSQSSDYNNNLPKVPMKPIEIMEKVVSHFTNNQTDNLDINMYCTSIDISDDGNKLYIGSNKGEVVIYDIKNKLHIKFEISNLNIRRIRISNDEKYIYSIDEEGISKLTFDSNFPTVKRINLKNVLDFFISNNDDNIFVIYEDGNVIETIQNLDLSSKNIVYKSDNRILSLDIDSLKNIMSLGCENGIVKLIKLNKKIELTYSCSKKNYITAISLLTISKLVFFGNNKGIFYMIKMDMKTVECKREINSKGITTIVPNQNHKYVIIGGADGKIVVWNIKHKQEIQILNQFKSPIMFIVINDLLIKENSNSALTIERRELINRDCQDEFNIYSISEGCINTSLILPFCNHEVIRLTEPLHEKLMIFSTKEKNDIYYCFDNETLYSLERQKINEEIKFEKKKFDCKENADKYTMIRNRNLLILISFTNPQKESINKKNIIKKITSNNQEKIIEIQSKTITSILISKKSNYAFIIQNDMCLTYENNELCEGSVKIYSKSLILLAYSKKGGSKGELFAVTQNKGIFYWQLPINDKNKQTINLRKKIVKKAEHIEKKSFLFIFYEDFRFEIWETIKKNRINKIKFSNLKDFLIFKKKLVICLFQDSISLYSIPELELHISFKIARNPLGFYLDKNDKNDKKIVVAYTNEIIFYKNVFVDKNNNKEQIAGCYNRVFDVYKYINEAIKEKLEDGTKNKRKRYKNKIRTVFHKAWVLNPYRINELHIYAYLNDYIRLEKALNEGIGMFKSKAGFTPLDICLEMNYEQSFCVFFSYIKSKRTNNPLFLSVLESSLIRLIDSQLKSSAKLFKLLFCRSLDNSLPKFYKVDVSFWKKKKLPFSFETYDLFPNDSNIKIIKNNLTMGNKLKFKQSYFRICMMPGSRESIHFLTRVIHNEKNIFGYKLEFISYILDQKWKRVKKIS
ncbi:hypothetical protein SteCoe_15128 [Stentor coeruleus]|uniref:Uncharacterized protein n=1 Tax=Stentor coeruleus TaxID=5963 RepID=A0A1R2C4C2_9CILI|nr:hypothetical protein SteCoe_15128 [Stentor coeruleus]